MNSIYIRNNPESLYGMQAKYFGGVIEACLKAIRCTSITMVINPVECPHH